MYLIAISGNTFCSQSALGVKMTDYPQSFQHVLSQPGDSPNEAGPVVQSPGTDKLEGQLTGKLVEHVEEVQETRVSPPKQ